MKLRQIDEEHLLVILTQEEAQSLGIFEADRRSPLRFNSFHSRLAAAKLLSIACSRGFACENRRISLRVLPSEDDRILLLFTLEKPPRRTYRIKHQAEPVVFRLADAGTALDVAERLARFAAARGVRFSLYRMQSDYALVFSAPLIARKALLILLGEYGVCHGHGALARAFVEEHGALLHTFTPAGET